MCWYVGAGLLVCAVHVYFRLCSYGTVHIVPCCSGITVGASDQPMLNHGWANATWERKQEIIADHLYFELGTFYYLANDPQVRGIEAQE